MSDEQMTINWPPVLAITIAALAVFLSVFALGKALATTPGDAGPTVAEDPAVQSGTTETVTLTEFAIEPGEAEVSAGTVVDVVNDGAAPHNLTLREADLATADLAAGESGSLDTASLAPGTYEWFCSIPGHESAGMVGTVTVTDDGATAAEPAEVGSNEVSGTADAAGMQEEMLGNMEGSIGAFPADTAGEGAAVLEPTILEDGTKLFELTVDETEWEVSPGEVVEAVAYNGIVPGPTMYADPGDRVTIRVVNELDHEGTSLHPHGLKDHAFEIDGVTFVSQDPIEPGDAMDYTFVADEESVVTYHSHHMSLHQVPNGLFGAMVIGDYASLAGFDDVAAEEVMILNDAGNIGFSLNGKSFPATEPYVYDRGDTVLVHYANEGQMAHPMHLHNQTGTVIAKDGFLLPEGARYQGDTFNVAPGERLSVVYEMDNVGTWLWHCHILSHVKQQDGSMFGMLTAVTVEE